MKKIILLVLFITYSFNISFASCACMDAFESMADAAQDDYNRASDACYNMYHPDDMPEWCSAEIRNMAYMAYMGCIDAAQNQQGQQYGEAVQDFNCCAPDFTGC